MRQPEVRIAVFGFLIAFLWEMWQMPFYQMVDLTVPQAVRGCSLGSFGDAGLMVLSYTVAAKVAGERDWAENYTLAALAAYLGTGLLITIAFEFVATREPWGWRYSEAMPREPFFGTGVVPIVMWIVVPLVVLWFCRNTKPIQ